MLPRQGRHSLILASGFEGVQHRRAEDAQLFRKRHNKIAVADLGVRAVHEREQLFGVLQHVALLVRHVALPPRLAGHLGHRLNIIDLLPEQ